MKITLKILYYLMFFLSIFVAIYGLTFFIVNDSSNDLVRKFSNYPFFAYSHIIGGAVALLLGPIQFNKNFRNKRLKVHRTIGLVYLISILFGSIGGIYLAVYAEGGLVAHFGFGLLAILWFIASLKAFINIKKRNIQKHRDWMIRSFALTLAAVMLRLYLPTFLFFFQVPFDSAYPLISWLCWVPNLVVAEWLLMNRNIVKI